MLLGSCVSQKELTAEDVATMKIAEFCTSYKSRLPPKPREKGDVTKAKVFQRPREAVVPLVKNFQCIWIVLKPLECYKAVRLL